MNDLKKKKWRTRKIELCFLSIVQALERTSLGFRWQEISQCKCRCWYKNKKKWARQGVMKTHAHPSKWYTIRTRHREGSLVPGEKQLVRRPFLAEKFQRLPPAVFLLSASVQVRSNRQRGESAGTMKIISVRDTRRDSSYPERCEKPLVAPVTSIRKNGRQQRHTHRLAPGDGKHSCKICILFCMLNPRSCRT